MPFITEFNTSLVLKKLIGEIPKEIEKWESYKTTIYFLNKLDKTNLFYFKKFCENPFQNIDAFFQPIKVVDNGNYVYEGSRPSYHKVENCDRLSSNFINFRIPEEIKEKGKLAIEEFRIWFKKNQIVFSEKPDVYQMQLYNKYRILQSIEKINYKNSGNVYKEDLTLLDIETRIDSLLHNAAKYYNLDLKRQEALKVFQKRTYLAFKSEQIKMPPTDYNDDELKEILKEYYFLFIHPTIFYLKEHFKVSYNSDIEINEKILKHLNFNKCNICYADDFEQKSNNVLEKKKKLVERFGDYEFPIEPTHFYFKDIENTDIRVAFIYCFIFRCLDKDFKTDDVGNYKMYYAEYINHKNKYIYKQTKIYEIDIPNIILFRKYITKIEKNKTTKITCFTTYNYEI